MPPCMVPCPLPDLRTIRNGIGSGPDGAVMQPAYPRPMRTSYAVKWREPDGQTYIGRLELGPRAIHLVGDGDRGSVERQIGYEELQGLRIGHDVGERLDG